MDQRTRKLMTTHKALHPKLANIKDSVDALIWRLEDYTEKQGGKLITAIENDTDNTKTNKMKITRKQKWEEKQLYGHFKQETKDISHKKTWT